MAKLTNEQKKRIAKVGTITLSYKDGSHPLHLEDLGLILDIENLNEELPEQKRSSINIPGSNSVLDTTYALTDAPVFENRNLEYVFKAYSSFIDRTEINAKLVNVFHGQEVRVVTSWHPDRYWSGNCAVELKYSSATCIDVTIKIDAEPYAYEVNKTELTINLNGTNTATLSNGSMWLTPLITVDSSSSISVSIHDKTVNITSGQSFKNDAIYLKGGDNSVRLVGNGTVTFSYTKGWL